tara:strand:- start:1186 stop:1410 length:225 start_codon:yes stop_codon:yes gene_type:complete
VSIKVSAKDNREIINAIRKVSPPAHLPMYRKVPRKNNTAMTILGVSLCIRFELDCFVFLRVGFRAMIIRFLVVD